MEKTLAYLRESLSNYTDGQKLPLNIFHKLQNNNYESEEDFVRDLEEEEVRFLNHVLPDEINYAMREQDYERVSELNEVYELLF
ncbi:sigma-G-dependent sporulation-specific acid-soluble spore protein CsgA [Bacillus timonensis]|nr:sigma-G-dependent sporulation-specific acid-soluble spore protein CsgA [Bacillus timonensis]